MKYMIPKKTLNYYSEVYRYKFLRRSKTIYLVLLLLLLCIAVSLPLIKVDISKSAPGIIQTERKKNLLNRTVDASAEEFKSLEISNFIYSGSAIAEIPPQTDLFVECYISPKDIGSVNNNQSVEFQIDAFDYREWGMASGIIERVANEITIINGKPVFQVICSLNESALFLNTFTRGELKNGMTLKTCFFDRNRSLFTLLFDQADDWYYLTQG